MTTTAQNKAHRTLRTGTRVRWVSPTGLSDETIGVVTDDHPVNPDGHVDTEFRWVSWPEGTELESIDNLTEA
jgi:hypothetical protein